MYFTIEVLFIICVFIWSTLNLFFCFGVTVSSTHNHPSLPVSIYQFPSCISSDSKSSVSRLVGSVYFIGTIHPVRNCGNLVSKFLGPEKYSKPVCHDTKSIFRLSRHVMFHNLWRYLLWINYETNKGLH